MAVWGMMDYDDVVVVGKACIGAMHGALHGICKFPICFSEDMVRKSAFWVLTAAC
jgi:hypothetical protein